MRNVEARAALLDGERNITATDNNRNTDDENDDDDDGDGGDDGDDGDDDDDDDDDDDGIMVTITLKPHVEPQSTDTKDARTLPILFPARNELYTPTISTIPAASYLGGRE